MPKDLTGRFSSATQLGKLRQLLGECSSLASQPGVESGVGSVGERPRQEKQVNLVGQGGGHSLDREGKPSQSQLGSVGKVVREGFQEEEATQWRPLEE